MIDPKFIGKTYEPVTYEVGREKIKEFAVALTDDSPVFLDPAASPHGDIIAPPTFVVRVQADAIAKLLFDREIDLNFMMLVHGEQEFEWFDVMRPGDVLVTQTTVKEIYEKDDNKDFIIGECVTKRGDQVVVVGRYNFVVRR
ncbi:MAG: MaoC family dehydratase N-terminal domain-containing protein [Candidatus Alcyoniella australis]|nr:MaoC family dehydratase N-terminal domain-containing protein [Candidatus Alcyoniella australis]